MTENTYEKDYIYINQEETKPKMSYKQRVGLALLATAGVGIGGLLYVKGLRDGHRLGFDKGIIYTVNHFADGMEVIVKHAAESKGE